MDTFNVTQCNVAQMIGEANRFVFHTILISISTSIVNGESISFDDKLFKTIVITAVAVICYHLFIRKLVEPPLKKMKIICRNRQTNKPHKKTNNTIN